MTRTLVLLSGGLDSAVILEGLRKTGQDVAALFFNYHQAAREREEKAALLLAKRAGAWFVRLDVDGLERADNSDVYPGRNAVLLALAASWAEARGVPWILYGANRDDFAHFPDCRPDFVNAMNRTFEISGLAVRVDAPLIHKSKDDVVRRARELGLDLDSVWSCYTGQPTPCGECRSCRQLEDAREAT